MNRSSGTNSGSARTGSIRARPNPIPVADRSALGLTTLEWQASGSGPLEVRVGGPSGPLFSRTGPSGSQATGRWVEHGTVFYLQDGSSERADEPSATLATVTVALQASLRARAARAVRHLRDDRRSRGLVLLYHRIADVALDPFGVCVSPDNFARQLDYLSGSYPVVALQAATQGLSENQLPARWIAITFDDGYADNFRVAWPVLERLSFPATVFLTGGFVDRAEDFWSTALARVLLEQPTLPAQLRLEVRGQHHEWELEELTPDGPVPHHWASWRVWEPYAPTRRHGALQALYRLLQPLPAHERDVVLGQLLTWAGASDMTVPAPWLSLDEASALGRLELIDLGAHSMSHSLLASEPEAAQREEIDRSRNLIHQLTGRNPSGFAYPYGGRDSYSETTLRLVRDSGFTYGCASWPGVVTAVSDRYQIPRIEIEDGNTDHFRRQLDRWWGEADG